MIRVSVEGMENLLRQIQHIPGAVEKASRSAVKKTLTTAKKAAGQKIRERYTIPAGEVTKTMKIKYTGGLSGELFSKGRVISLRRFRHTPKQPLHGKRGKYIFAQVVKGQGGILRRAFKTRSGSPIFEREGRTRIPIRKMTGPSPPGMLGSPPVSQYIVQNMERKIGENLIAEVSKTLGG